MFTFTTYTYIYVLYLLLFTPIRITYDICLRTCCWCRRIPCHANLHALQTSTPQLLVLEAVPSPSPGGKTDPCSWDESQGWKVNWFEVESRVFKNIQGPFLSTFSVVSWKSKGIPHPQQRRLMFIMVAAEASFNTLCWSLSFIVVLQCIAGMARKTQHWWW